MLDLLIRWRTWIYNTILALLFALPGILNSPEILAVIPSEYQRWFLVAAFLVNNWIRPRPASRAGDAEVQVAKAVNSGDTVLVVSPDAGTKAVVAVK